MKSYIEQLKFKLKENGFKLTPQRRSIVETMIHSKGNHLSSEEIYQRVKQNCPEIGLATVYRTLQMLDIIGASKKLTLYDGCVRYELHLDNNSHNHHHLICKKCGRIIEVEEDLLDHLENKIEKKYKFQINDHDVKFYGICINCL